MADRPHAPCVLARWRLRAGSWPLGEGMPARHHPISYGGVAAAINELLEDTTDDRRGDRVGFEPVQSLAVRCLAWVGMRPSVGERVAIRGAAPKKSPLVPPQVGHWGPDAYLDAVALALAHAAVQAHH